MTARSEIVHGTGNAYRQGCRCDECASSRATHSREARLRRIRETPFDKIPHGRKGYGLYMCRCDTCREASSVESAERRKVLSQRADVPHGTLNAYTNYGCRCSECVAVRKEFKRTYDLRERYGITPDDYSNLLARQGGNCAICESDVSQSGSVDHCHECKRVRGILCAECNFGLGHSRDSVEIIERSIAYILERNPL